MNKLINILILCVTVLLLTGCFPGKRMYVVTDCSLEVCSRMPNGSEFAFVKQANGSKYEIWVNQQPNVTNGPMLVLGCEAPVEHNKFECNLCGSPDSFKIAKVSGSGCGYAKCVKIEMLQTPECPAGGRGTGGSN